MNTITHIYFLVICTFLGVSNSAIAGKLVSSDGAKLSDPNVRAVVDRLTPRIERSLQGVTLLKMLMRAKQQGKKIDDPLVAEGSDPIEQAIAGMDDDITGDLFDFALSLGQDPK